MLHTTRIGWWLVGLAIVAGLIALVVFSPRYADPERMVKRMQAQVAQIRGLKFKHDVVVLEQSPEEFKKSTASRLRQLSLPENEPVLRTLGLLASDETLDADALSKRLDSNSAAGEYDPYSGRLLIATKPGQLQRGGTLDDIYARELHRALLDQHFDLKTYLERRQQGGSLNSDEWLARQMLVEGETFYFTVLREVKLKLGRIPDYLPLEDAFARTLDTDELVDAISDPRLPQSEGLPREQERKPGSLPRFLTQLTKGVRKDALLFVHDVRLRGWDDVDRLYTTSPPVSTEQILHPEKWSRNERPVTIEWPAFETNATFADWELLQQDVLGELMLRAVFRVHHLSPMMGSSPAGWNGDRFAVFKRRDSGDMLLLLYTVWDSESDAKAFAGSYGYVVKAKYADAPQPVRIVADGRRVVIVEGGDEASLDALMTFAQSAQETADIAVEK